MDEQDLSLGRANTPSSASEAAAWDESPLRLAADYIEAIGEERDLGARSQEEETLMLRSCEHSLEYAEQRMHNLQTFHNGLSEDMQEIYSEAANSIHKQGQRILLLSDTKLTSLDLWAISIDRAFQERGPFPMDSFRLLVMKGDAPCFRVLSLPGTQQQLLKNGTNEFQTGLRIPVRPDSQQGNAPQLVVKHHVCTYESAWFRQLCLRQVNVSAAPNAGWARDSSVLPNGSLDKDCLRRPAERLHFFWEFQDERTFQPNHVLMDSGRLQKSGGSTGFGEWQRHNADLRKRFSFRCENVKQLQKNMKDGSQQVIPTNYSPWVHPNTWHSMKEAIRYGNWARKYSDYQPRSLFESMLLKVFMLLKWLLAGLPPEVRSMIWWHVEHDGFHSQWEEVNKAVKSESLARSRLMWALESLHELHRLRLWASEGPQNSEEGAIQLAVDRSKQKLAELAENPEVVNCSRFGVWSRRRSHDEQVTHETVLEPLQVALDRVRTKYVALVKAAQNSRRMAGKRENALAKYEAWQHKRWQEQGSPARSQQSHDEM